MEWFSLAHTSQLWLFFILVFGIIVLPGMDMAFVLGSTLVDGRRGGVAALAGIVAGGVAHTAMEPLLARFAASTAVHDRNGALLRLTLAADGTYRLPVTLGQVSPKLVEAVLLYEDRQFFRHPGVNGWSLLRGASALGEVRDQASRPWGATFRRGLLTCLLNPKAYLFMIAVYPQFARPEHGSMAVQALAMGAIIALTQAAVYGAVALGAVRLRDWLRGSGRAQVLAGQSVGVVLLLGAAWSLAQAFGFH